MERICAPEVFTPEQWADFWGAPKDLIGNKLFAVGMLKAAWDDARLYPKNRRAMLDRQSALDWIRGTPPGRIPMTTCCEFLGIDADWLRNGLLTRVQESLNFHARQFRLKSVSPHHTTLRPSRAARMAARLEVLKLP
jgi:hypothetical protein